MEPICRFAVAVRRDRVIGPFWALPNIVGANSVFVHRFFHDFD